MDGTKPAEGKADDSSLTPKIMASYETVSLPSQSGIPSDSVSPLQTQIKPQLSSETVQDRDRDEGADSVLEDE